MTIHIAQHWLWYGAGVLTLPGLFLLGAILTA